MFSSDLAPSEAAVSVADYTSPRLIVPHLRGKDTASAIQELSQTLHREGWLPDWLSFYHSAINREYFVSSEMEGNIAFPHTQVPGLQRLVFALGRSIEALPWKTKAGQGVHLVFLVAVPATEATHYLTLIAGLSSLQRHGDLLQQLLTASDAFQMLEVLQGIKLRKSPSTTL